jgi:hypothetical protein
MSGHCKSQLQNGDVESLSAAPADSLRLFELEVRICAQPAGMLKPPVTNKLDARRLQKVSLFLTSSLWSIQLHCALFGGQGASLCGADAPVGPLVRQRSGWISTGRRAYIDE